MGCGPGLGLVPRSTQGNNRFHQHSTVPRASLALTHLVLPTTVEEKSQAHLRDEEPEAQRDNPCLKGLSLGQAGQQHILQMRGPDHALLCPQPFPLFFSQLCLPSWGYSEPEAFGTNGLALGGCPALCVTQAPVWAELLVALGFSPFSSCPCSLPLASTPHPTLLTVQPHSKPPWSPSH